MTRPILAPELEALDGVRHGFFSRQGGVSEGAYASLNCGLGSRDAPERVRENRGRVAARLGVAPDRLVTCFQIHSDVAVAVDAAFEASARPRADALVTTTRGLALGVLAADCAPILFADPAAGVIAAAHAGWRGALGGIVESAIEAMLAAGAVRANISAIVGPCIAQPSYEIGPEVRAAFVDRAPADARFFRPSERAGHARFDLPGYVVARLQGAGIAAARALGHDTYGDADRFFSYRRATHRGEDGYGRMIAAIALT